MVPPGSSLSDFYATASPRDRGILEQLNRLETYEAAARRARRVSAGLGPEPSLQARSPQSAASQAATALLPPAAALEVAGGWNAVVDHLSAGHGGGLRPWLNTARALAVETPRAYVEQRGAPLKADAQLGLDSLTGLVKVPFALARGQGGELLDSIAADYRDRYDEARAGDFPGYREQVGRSGGLSYGFDVAPVAAGLLKVGGGLAKAGALGARAERVVTQPRALRRVSPGDTRRQHDETDKLLPNPVRVATQRRRDTKREKAHQAREAKAARQAEQAKARGEIPEGTRRLTQPAAPVKLTAKAEARIRDAGGEVVHDRAGEVGAVVIPARSLGRFNQGHLRDAGWTPQAGPGRVTFFPPREVVSRHRLRERIEQRKSPARRKGRAVSELRGLTADARREFARALKPLSKPERSALFYAVTQGARRVEHLDPIEAAIIAERTTPDGTLTKPGRFEADELDKIRWLRAHADEAFTPALAAAVEKLRPLIRRGEDDNPLLPRAQATNARYGPQAEALGVQRRDVPIERFDAAATAKSIERRDRKRGVSPDGPVDVVLAPGRARKRADGKQPPRGLVVRRQGEAEGVPLARFVRSARARANVRRLTIPAGAMNPAGQTRLARVLGSEGFAARHYDDGSVVYERNTAQAPRALREAATETRRERSGEFIGRVIAAREPDRGAPEFAPSERYVTPKFGQFAAGGTAVPKLPARRTYSLQRRGLQRTDAQVIYDGVQRNLKTRVTANLVADVYDMHAHPKYRDMSLRELKRAQDAEGFDATQTAFWFPRRFRAALAEVGEQAEDFRASGRRPEGDLDDLEAVPPELQDAVKAAVLPGDIDVARLARVAPEWLEVRGTIIPRSVHNEIFASLNREGKVERFLERLKTVQSRTVLGLLNVNWLQADFFGNAAFAMASGAGPISAIRGMRFFRQLPKPIRDKIEAELDVGNARFQTHVPHYGSTINTRWANTWRAWRQTPMGQHARPLRKTIDAFLAAEKLIANDPWRYAVAYKLLRSEAFRRIDRNAGSLNGAMDRLVTVMGRKPEKQMEALLKEPRMVEHVGRLVDEILGDFSTMTALERRTVGRFLFFYPWLRFSIRATFYTLPMNHPVRVAVVANLGRLTEAEQRELLGVRDEEKGIMRGLMAGRFFFRDDKGKLREMNIRTYSPTGNAVTEGEGSEDLLLATPPWVQWALGQLQKRDQFRGRPWNVGGTTTRPTTATPLGSLTENLTRRGRIFLRQYLELPPPTREAMRHFLPGEQSDESLPGFEVPMTYKSAERQAQADARRARDEDESLAEQLLRSAFRGFTSKPSEIEVQVARRRIRAGLPTPFDPDGAAPATGSGRWSVIDQRRATETRRRSRSSARWEVLDANRQP